MSFVETSFTDSASLIAHYKAVRQRLFAPKGRTLAPSIVARAFDSKAKPDAEPIPVLAPLPAPSEPIEADPTKRDWLDLSKPDIGTPYVVPAFRWQQISRQVCEKHGITWAQMLQGTRSAARVNARGELYYRLSRETTLSMAEIGRRLGRDHTTVIYGIARHMRLHGLTE